MSAYGINIKNGTDELTISSGGKLLTCIGKATYSRTQQTVGNVTDGKPGRIFSYMVYTIPTGLQYLLAIDLPLNQNVGILSWAYYPTVLASNEIGIYCGSSMDNYGYDTVQTPIDVWIFTAVAPGATPVSTWGLCLYDSAGNLSYDFGRSYPLYPRKTLMAGGTTDIIIPNLTRPVMLGTPRRIRGESSPRGAPWYDYQYYEYYTMWKRTDATTVKQVEISRKAYHWFEETPDYDNITEDAGGWCFVLDGATLP